MLSAKTENLPGRLITQSGYSHTLSLILIWLTPIISFASSVFFYYILILNPKTVVQTQTLQLIDLISLGAKSSEMRNKVGRFTITIFVQHTRVGHKTSYLYYSKTPT